MFMFKNKNYYNYKNYNIIIITFFFPPLLHITIFTKNRI